MKVKMILPALTEALSPYWRPIKYSLFPPLGLATLAGYLDDDDEVVIQDEHVEPLDLDDERKRRLVGVYLPRFLQDPFLQFAGAKGGDDDDHRRFARGAKIYLFCIFQKC